MGGTSPGLRPLDALTAAAAIWRHRRAARERVLEFQAARLRRVIAHAHAAVPFHRARLERDRIDPAHIRTAADIAALPISTRRELQAAASAEVLAAGAHPDRLIAYTTSGSTGEPLALYRTRLEEQVNSVVRFRAFRDFGLRATDVRAVLRAGVGPLPVEAARGWGSAGSLLRSVGVYRKTMVNSGADPTVVAAALARIRPDVVSGPPGVLARIATTSGRDAASPRLIVAGAEVLTPLARRLITDGFGARVADLYGSHELGVIAWQCATEPYLHVADDAVLVEVLVDGRPAKPGETGELVGTRLHALAMPFIRYAQGDLVMRGPTPCPCGAPFSTLIAIEGRVSDYFTRPDGRPLHPSRLVWIVHRHAHRWLAHFQLTQETADRVVLRTVARVSPTSEEVAALTAALGEALAPDIALAIEPVADIPPEPNGKVQVTRTRVAPRS